MKKNISVFGQGLHVKTNHFIETIFHVNSARYFEICKKYFFHFVEKLNLNKE